MKWTARPSATAPSIASASTGFVEQRAVLDREVDARELLVDDAPGTDVEVPDLGVAHLALGQPDGEPGARRACVARALREQRGRGSACRRALDGVARRGSAAAEAVHDDEQRGQVLRHSRRSPLAVDSIATNELGLQRRSADERAVDVGLAA